jgi:hypothetical protein
LCRSAAAPKQAAKQEAAKEAAKQAAKQESKQESKQVQSPKQEAAKSVVQPAKTFSPELKRQLSASAEMPQAKRRKARAGASPADGKVRLSHHPVSLCDPFPPVASGVASAVF